MTRTNAELGEKVDKLEQLVASGLGVDTRTESQLAQAREAEKEAQEQLEKQQRVESEAAALREAAAAQELIDRTNREAEEQQKADKQTLAAAEKSVSKQAKAAVGQERGSSPTERPLHTSNVPEEIAHDSETQISHQQALPATPKSNPDESTQKSGASKSSTAKK